MSSCLFALNDERHAIYENIFRALFSKAKEHLYEAEEKLQNYFKFMDVSKYITELVDPQIKWHDSKVA